MFTRLFLFQKYYKLIAVDLSKQQKLCANPKYRAESAKIFFIIEEAKETVLDFSKGTFEVLWFYFVLIKY